MLKDDKSYPFIKVTVQEAYPRVLFARRMKKDKNRYFVRIQAEGRERTLSSLCGNCIRYDPAAEHFPETAEKTVPVFIII